MAFTLPIWRQSLCAVSGAIVGGMAGMVVGFSQTMPASPILTLIEALKTGLVLGLFGWIMLLVLLGAWLHYGFSAVAGPALLNALLSAILTVLVCNALHIPILDTLLGLLIGTLIGWLLCLWCGRWAGVKGVAR